MNKATMQNEMRDRLMELVIDAEIEWQRSIKGFAEVCADYLIENGVIVPPCKVGDGIWVVEEDDITCYMFLAKSKGCIIATSWINDYDLDETIEYHIAETQDNFDTGLAVFPENICFATREEAEQALKGGTYNVK